MELKSFLKTHLASYKVPKDFIMLDELPKGSTGKTLKRRGSATLLVRYGILRDPNRLAAYGLKKGGVDWGRSFGCEGIVLVMVMVDRQDRG
jgi:hypothetical protein